MNPICRATLTELANKFGSDKGDQVRDRHGYSYVYDLLLGPSRDQPVALLEIGLAVGGPETEGGRTDRKVDSPSVAMWLEYFSQAQIYGFDISDFSHLQHERFKFIRGDAGSRTDLDQLKSEVPLLDFIIDDGSHASYHQQHCLKHLWPHLKPGGLYIVEDLHWQSPIYETELPPVPLTARLFEGSLNQGSFADSALFASNDLCMLRAEIETYAVFRDHAGRSAVPKLLVLRKRVTAQTGGVALAPAVGAPALQIDRPIEPSRLPRVRSFDLFDTLVARRCIQPKGIFDLIEDRLTINGFAAYRMAAEAGIAHDEYGLEDIYVRLAQDRPDLAGQLVEAQRLEVELELKQLFPIAENIQKVSPGDIIVSDMYLPPKVLETIIRDIAGLRDVTFFVSSHGKQRQTIWPELKKNFDIVGHLGDNLETDVRSPAAHNISAHHSSVSNPNAIEQEIIALGLPRLGEAVREARLTTWGDDLEERQLQILQSNVNTPLLLIATFLVFRAARQAGVTRLLASGRDCYLWLHLIKHLEGEFAPDITSDYFFTSRICRSFPSETYAEYVRSLCGDQKTFILDVCGTGWSLQRLCEQLGLLAARPLLIQKMKDALIRKRYESWAPTAGTASVFALLDPDLVLNNELVELANPAPHPTVLDIALNQGLGIPIFPEWPIGPVSSRFGKVQQEAFLTSAGVLLTRAVLDELAAAPSLVLVNVLGMLYSRYQNFAGTLHKLAPEHRIEDSKVCAVLARLGDIAATGTKAA